MADWNIMPIAEYSTLTQLTLLVVVLIVGAAMIGLVTLATGPGGLDDGAVSTPTPAPTATPAVTDTETRTATPEPASTLATEQVAYIEQLERNVEGLGEAEIVHLSEAQDAVFIDYQIRVVTEERVQEQLASIAVSYAYVVEQGWEIPRLEATIVNRNDVPIGFWYIERSWAVDYNTGAISVGEYGRLIAGTLEVNQ